MMLSGLLTALIATAPGGPLPSPPAILRMTQITIRRQLIIRVPARAVRPAPLAWKERKGDRCVTMAAIGGAAVVARDSVDFILRGGQRVRARLESACPALDFYSGFYVLPTADGRICADRDAIHDRSGNECGIERFRKLTPKAPAKH